MPASDDHHSAIDRQTAPFDTLTGALGGLFVGHCLASVARFSVADALDDTPDGRGAGRGYRRES